KKGYWRKICKRIVTICNRIDFDFTAERSYNWKSVRRHTMQKFLKPLLALKTKRGYSIFSAVVVTLFSTWVIYDATKFQVVLVANGEETEVKTHAKTVAGLLEDEGITINKHDYLSHTVDTPLTDGMVIEYKEAKKVFLTVDGAESKHYTTATTVGEFLNKEQ